jgi:hypothetical protein
VRTKTTLSRSHRKRSYWGESDAALLISWLNDPSPPKNDDVEKLLQLYAKCTIVNEIVGKTFPHQFRTYANKLVKKSRFGNAPVVSLEGFQLKVHWRYAGNMAPKQALALAKLFLLLDRGLLSRVRKCARRDCDCWLYARSEKHTFHSDPCRVKTYHATEAAKERHRLQMQRSRAAAKERDRKNLEVAKRRRKS